jgi:hypothetical protein
MAAFPRWAGPPIAAAVMMLATGCDERDRLTFPTPSDGIGPVTTIEQPARADTTIPSGGIFSVNGATVDPDGVATVHFLVTGGSGHPPFTPNPPQTTVTFGVPLATFGHSGETIEIQIYGVDVLGNRGGTSTRLIHIQ